MLSIDGPEQLRALVGQELGVSDWVEISQADVDAFADVTGDHQWIHVDVERATASPFGGTIVHGYFTLSLIPRLGAMVYQINGFGYALNYGLNKVRFPGPLPVGSSVRVRPQLTELTDLDGGGIQAVITSTFERQGATKPVCVAESVVRLYPEGTAR